MDIIEALKIFHDAREIVRDFNNGEISLEELNSYFFLKKCETCDNYELDDDLIDTCCGKICQTCIKNL